MKKKVTIKDIAKLAGVSTTTVSHFLNGNYSKMSEQTRNKIKNIIKITGYRPNNIAVSLATSTSNTIGVVIADITNPFISAVMKGINDECYNNGYSVTFTNSYNSPRAEVDNIKRLCKKNISEIILDPVYADNPAFEFLNNN